MTATSLPHLAPRSSLATADDDAGVEEATLLTGDGTPIAARLFVPVTPPRGAVLVVPAMGVAQSFYRALAGWLRGEGFTVLTFDFRGVAASRTRPLREETADIMTWARQDTRAALEALERRAPGLPITWIGHSLGGQIVPFVPGHERVARVVTIAAGSGYWRETAPQLRRKVWLFWFGLVPALTPLFGYFPGRRLGMVGDLPKNAVRQWRRWCLDPEYAAGAEGEAVRAAYAAVTRPITSLSFTDDEMMSEKNVASIHAHYASAPRSMKRFDPSTLGVERVGHFGFFRGAMASAWRDHLRPELAAL